LDDLPEGFAHPAGQGVKGRQELVALGDQDLAISRS
jgi:hypothetical protein